MVLLCGKRKGMLMETKEDIRFKDRITKTEYTSLIRELINAIDSGENALKSILFGTMEPELYAAHGTYKEGGHNRCGGLSGDRFTEKRLCRCMYYKNGKYYNSNDCEKCEFQDRFAIIGDYQITDYEVPAYFYGTGIGEIDLIISDGTIQYATELKAFKGNDETLLRMVSQIMTYTAGYPAGQYQKAIAFFEGTTQADEFVQSSPEMAELFQKGNITVFCFKKVNEKAYKICKL